MHLLVLEKGGVTAQNRQKAQRWLHPAAETHPTASIDNTVHILLGSGVTWMSIMLHVTLQHGIKQTLEQRPQD